MATEILTKNPTEAELEAKIRAALCKVFPWIPEGALTHQVRFSLTIGRAKIDIDGSATAEGRSDTNANSGRGTVCYGNSSSMHAKS